MKDFKKLQVWAKAHELTLEIYRVTHSFPHDEQYGLSSQLKRACSSIPANIAEGCGRNSNNELVRFLDIAMGSASETQYHVLLARDLGYVSHDDYPDLDSRIEEVKRMLGSLITKIRHDLND
jgi:four helix bundle protein